MHKLMLLVLVTFFPSCTLYRSLTENSEKVQEGIKTTVAVIKDVKIKYDKLTEIVNIVVSKVDDLNQDQDGDGDVDLTDLLMGLGLLGGVGGAAGAARAKMSNGKKAEERERARTAEADLDKRLALLEKV